MIENDGLEKIKADAQAASSKYKKENPKEKKSEQLNPDNFMFSDDLIHNRTRGFTEEQEEDIVSYYDEIDRSKKHNNDIKAKNKERELYENRDKTFFDAFVESHRKGESVFGITPDPLAFINTVIQGGIYEMDAEDNAIGTAAKTVQSTVDAGRNYVNQVGLMLSTWFDVTDLRAANVLPDETSFINLLSNFGQGFNSLRGYVGGKIDPGFEDEHFKKNQERNEEIQLWADKQLNDVSNSNTELSDLWEKIDEEFFIPLDNKIGDGTDKYGNAIRDYFIEENARINALRSFETEFSWADKDSSVLSSDFIGYTMNVLKEGIPQLAAQISTGKGVFKVAEWLKKSKTTLDKVAIMEAAIKAKKSLIKSNTITKAGLTLANVNNESMMIGDEAKDALIENEATKIGGKDFQNAWLEKQQEIYSSSVGLGGQFINNIIVQEKKKFIDEWFSENKPEEYEILKNKGNDAANIAIKSNNIMIFTEAYDVSLIDKIGKYKKVAKALGDSKYSRKALGKVSLKNSLGTVAKAGAVEGFEEGGINKFAAWKGEAWANGEKFTFLDWYNRAIRDGEAADDIFAGVLLGSGMGFISEFSNYGNKKEAYETWKKQYDRWEKELNPVNIKTKRDLQSVAKSKGNQEVLAMQISKAMSENKDISMLQDQHLINQSALAFETGTTEQLLNFYQQVITNNKDQSVVLEAQKAVTEILKYEELFNVASKYANKHDVFSALATKNSIEEVIKELSNPTSTLLDNLQTKLSSLNADIDADFSITNGEVVFNGKDAKVFQDLAIKTDEMNDFVNRDQDLKSAKKQLNSIKRNINILTSESTQKSIADVRTLLKDVKKNFSNIYGVDTKEEFLTEIDKLISKYQLTIKEKKEVRKHLLTNFNSFTSKKQRERAIVKNEIAKKSKNPQRNKFDTTTVKDATTRLFNDSKNIDESISNDTRKEDIELLKSTVESVISDSNGNVTDFDSFIKEILGYNEAEYSNSEKEEIKNEVKKNYKVYELGWKSTGRPLDSKAVYNKYFISKIDRMKARASIFNKLASKLDDNVETEESETTNENPVSNIPKEIVEEKTVPISKKVSTASESEKKSMNEKRFGYKFKVQILARTIENINGVMKVVAGTWFDSRRFLNQNILGAGNKVNFTIGNIPNINVSITANGKQLKKLPWNEFFNFKFKDRRSNKTKGSSTKYSKKDNIIKFFEETSKGEKRNGKLYDHYSKGPLYNKQNGNIFINDDFFVLDDEQDGMLRDTNIETVTLLEMQTGENSHIKVEIKKLSGETSLYTIAVADQNDSFEPIFTQDIDGKIVGVLHTIDNIELAFNDGLISTRKRKKEQLLYRKSILNGEVKAATINSKITTGYDTLPIDEHHVISSQDPDALFVVWADNKFKIGNSNFSNVSREIVNENDILKNNKGEQTARKLGVTYEVRKIGTKLKEYKGVIKKVDIYKAFPVDMGLATSTDKNNVIGAIKAFIDGKYGMNKGSMIDNPSIVQKILSTTGINNVKTLSDYIGNFIMNTPGKSLDNNGNIDVEKFKNETINGPSDIRFATRGNMFIVVAKKRDSDGEVIGSDIARFVLPKEGVKMNNGNIQQMNKLLSILETNYTKLRRNHSTKGYASKQKILTFDEFGNIDDETTYDKYTINSVKTNIKGHKVVEEGQEPFYATGTNPIIELDTSIETKALVQSPITKEVTKPEPVQESITTEQVEKVTEASSELLKDIKKALVELGSKNTDVLFSNISSIDESIGNLSQEDIQKIINDTEKIQGVNPQQLHTIVLAVLNNIINESGTEKINKKFVDDNLKTAFDKLLKVKKTEYESFITKLKGFNNNKYNKIIEEFETRLKIFDSIENEWGVVETFTKELFKKYLNIDTNKDQLSAIDQQEKDVESSTKIHEKESVEYEGKDSVPTELKKFFAGIHQKNIDGTVPRGFLGLPLYMPFDKTMNIISHIIGSIPKSDMTYDDMINEMVKYEDVYPFIHDVMFKLQNADRTLQIKFMKHMNKHNMSMKFVSFNYDNKTKKYNIQLRNTNSGEVSRILNDEWKETLKIKTLVNDNGSINVAHANKLYDEFKNFTVDTDHDVLINWLKEFGISIGKETLKQVQDNRLRDNTGTVLRYINMFNSNKKSKGLFGGLAVMLDEYINNPDISKVNIFDESQSNHPFISINSTLNNLAKIEGMYNTRVLTIAFRSGDKNINGYIPSKFATDRVEDLTSDFKLLEQLKSDPYSKDSMLLNLLMGDDTTELVSESLHTTHVDLEALKPRGEKSNPNNALSKMIDIDQETTQKGFFQYSRQGSSVSYKNIPLRIASMFFPTMSDKKQMLALTMPVFNFSGKHIKFNGGKLELNFETLEVLFEQLVQPELNRIIKYHENKKAGIEENVKGYDKAAQMFLLLPQINEIEVDGNNILKIIHDSIMNGEGINQIWLKTQIASKAYDIITNVISNEIKLKSDTEQIIDSEYKSLKTKDEYNPVPSTDILKFSSADFIINNMISLSNMFQLIAGDIAFYSNDKMFGDFGVDTTILGPEFKNISSFNDAKSKVKELESSNRLTADEAQAINSLLDPKPHLPSEKGTYTEVVKNISTNLGKRLALLLAPGDKVNGITDKQYLQLFLNDVESEATNIEYLVKLHYGDKGLTDLKALNGNLKKASGLFPIINSFFSIETTDAQEYTTAQEHLDILLNADGKITEEQYIYYSEKIQDQEENGITEENEINYDDLKIIFQPLKPVHTGSTFDPTTGKMRMIYVKTSSYPLLPQATAGTKLEPLRAAMYNLQKKQNMNVRATYKTGSKVGATKTGIEPFSGKLDNDTLLESSAIVDRKNFRIQQDVPVHALETTKDEVLIGTQLMKLLFGDGVTDIQDINFMDSTISGRDLLNEYDNTYKDLIDITKQELFTELGLDSDGNVVNEEDFLVKLSTMLKKEATSRNYPKQDIDGVEIIRNSDGTLRLRNSIWLSTNAIRYEGLLNSLITKKLVKLKLPGYSYVAGSREGYQITDDVNLLNKKEQSRIIYTDKFDGKSLKAKTDNNKAQIFIPSRFRAIDGSLINLFQGEGDDRKYVSKINGRWQLKQDMVGEDLMDITSFRIPTSSHVSASQVEIAGFLPPENGDLMIVPSEFSPQKGLDYDVDKEFSYHLLHATTADGKIVSLENLFNNENLNDLLITTKKELQSYRLTFNNEVQFLKILQEIENTDEVSNDIINDVIKKSETPTVIDKKLTITAQDIKNKQFEIKLIKDFKKKNLQNKLVRINSAIISSNNPIIQRKINKVLSMDFAGAQAKLLQDSEAGFTTILSDSYQRNKMNLGAVGQMGIGVYSNYVVLNSLLQQQEDKVYLKSVSDGTISRLNIEIGSYKSDGRLGRYTNIISNEDIDTILSYYQGEDSNFEQKLKNGLIHYDDITEILINTNDRSILSFIRPISEAFAEKQNTATDNEKEQIMGRVGVTSETINVDSLLTLLGFDKAESIFNIDGELVKEGMSLSYLLISQPIVKAYVKAKAARKSSIIKNYTSNTELIDNLKTQFESNNKSPNSDLTPQVLYDNIKKETNNSDQLAVLDLFIELENSGRDINKVQNLMSITKDGLGKEFVNTINLKNQLIEFNTLQAFSDNITDLIGDFKELPTNNIDKQKDLDNGYVELEDVMIKPKTMMGHLIVNSIVSGYKLWNPLFPYENKAIINITHKIQELSNISESNSNEMADLKQLVIKELKKYMNTIQNLGTIHGDPETERVRLFKNSKISPSLGAYILKLKSDNNELLHSNPLLSKLKVLNDDDNKISKLIFDNTTEHAFDEEVMYHAFATLLSENTPLPDNKNIKVAGKKIKIPELTTIVNTMISNGLKTISVSNSNNEMSIGEKGFTTLNNGERVIVEYIGEMSINNYPSDFLMDNGLSDEDLDMTTKSFVEQGHKKHVFKYTPVYTTLMLAQDLISYSFLSGEQSGAIDFTKYIPMSFLERIGYNEFMNSIDVHDDVLFNELMNYEEDNAGFLIQFFQHNSNKLKAFAAREFNVNVNASSVSKEPFASDDGTYPKMIGIRNKGVIQPYILGSEKYFKLPIAGIHGMSEYNINVKNVNSIVNNEAKVAPISKRDFNDSNSLNTKEYDYFNYDSGQPLVVLSHISDLDSDYGKLAGVLLNIPTEITPIISKKPIYGLGAYSSDNNEITINTRIIENSSKEQQAQTFLHEYLHFLTSDYINKYFSHDNKLLVDKKDVPKDLQQLANLYTITKAEIDSKYSLTKEIYDSLNKKIVDKRNGISIEFTDKEQQAYMFYNYKEFVTSVMTEQDLINDMKDITVLDLSLFDRFVTFILDMIKSRSNNETLHDITSDSIINIIEGINKESVELDPNDPTFDADVYINGIFNIDTKHVMPIKKEANLTDDEFIGNIENAISIINSSFGTVNLKDLNCSKK